MIQLRGALPVAEPLEICEPQEFAQRESQPSCQLFCGFDGRKVPTFGDPDRLHLPGTGKPMLDGNFVSVFPPGSSETRITTKKLDYLAMARSRFS
jgi:hypothetical protein